MTEDIFDRVDGYDQLHDMLATLNKLMIEIEAGDKHAQRKWAEIKFGVLTPKGVIEIKGIDLRHKEDIENCKTIINIDFLIKEDMVNDND